MRLVAPAHLSANPGRSGSQYLAELLDESPNVIAGQ